jgi:hypothetical protein
MKQRLLQQIHIEIEATVHKASVMHSSIIHMLCVRAGWRPRRCAVDGRKHLTTPPPKVVPTLGFNSLPHLR